MILPQWVWETLSVHFTLTRYFFALDFFFFVLFCLGRALHWIDYKWKLYSLVPKKQTALKQRYRTKTISKFHFTDFSVQQNNVLCSKYNFKTFIISALKIWSIISCVFGWLCLPFRFHLAVFYWLSPHMHICPKQRRSSNKTALYNSKSCSIKE